MPDYPLTPPTYPGYVTSKFNLSRVVASTRSTFSGQQQFQAHSGRWWHGTCQLPAMTQTWAARWQAFFHTLRGPVGTFLMGDPDRQAPLGQALGSPAVLGAVAAGVDRLPTNGWDPSVTGQLVQGDYIQVGSDLYVVAYGADVDSDGTGFADIPIEPLLRTALVGSEPLILHNTRAVMRLVSETTDFGGTVERYMAPYSFAFEEAI